MTALGLDVGSCCTKLAWHDGGQSRTARVDVPGYEPDALRSALTAELARHTLGRPDGVVIAVPEAWRDDPGSPAARLIAAVEAVVEGVRVRPVGVPVAVVAELARSGPSPARAVVVDAGASTVEVAALVAERRPRLVRHELDGNRSAAALEALFRTVCGPLLERDEQIDVALVGGYGDHEWVDEAIRHAVGGNVRLQMMKVGDPWTCAARGALRLAGDPGGLAQPYPWPVKAWVGRRRNGHLVNEERLLTGANEVEIGGFTAQALFVPDEPVRIGPAGEDPDEGTAELPRLWVETPDRCHLLRVTVSDLPPGCYTVDLHLDQRRTGALLLQPVGADPDRRVLGCGVLPSPAAQFPQNLQDDLVLIRAWGVRETGKIPRMREVVEALRREKRSQPNPKMVSGADGESRNLIDVALTERPPPGYQARARGIWRDDIIMQWKKVVPGLAEPPPVPGLDDGRDKLVRCRAMWGALRRVDHYLQGLPEADWPSYLADVRT